MGMPTIYFASLACVCEISPFVRSSISDASIPREENRGREGEREKERGRERERERRRGVHQTELQVIFYWPKVKSFVLAPSVCVCVCHLSRLGMAGRTCKVSK